MTVRAFCGTFNAMGCTFRVCVAADGPEQARRALATARSVAEQLEAVLSRFREDSHLVRLNRDGGGWRRVHPVLWRAVRWALWAAQQTGGLYDPTVLDRVEAAGYTQSFPHVQCDSLPASDPTVFGRWTGVKVHPHRSLVRLPAGLRLDLGGVGKALAAEWIASAVRAFGPCLVDAGGDVAVRDCTPGWPGWPVAVEGSHGVVGSLWLRRGSLATSGTTVRRWRVAGQPVCHIVDPRTGLPVSTDVATATVWAPHAAEANAHALALVVVGSGGAPEYVHNHPGLRALLTTHDGAVRSFGLELEPPDPDILPEGGLLKWDGTPR